MKPKLFPKNTDDSYYLDLQENQETGGIFLRIVDSRGVRVSNGDVLMIKPNGTIEFMDCINPIAAKKAGISLTQRGTIAHGV